MPLRVPVAPRAEVDPDGTPALRFNVHGLGARVACAPVAVRQVLGDVWRDFAESDWPDGFPCVSGRVDLYDADAVVRRISPDAQRHALLADDAELWRDGDRSILIDGDWGACELDLSRGRFHSWLLPEAAADAPRAVERAIVWPLAQLLAPRGLTLVPAASVCWGRTGVLVVAPFNVQPELDALLDAGAQLVAQSWTALRDEPGRTRPWLLRVPGRTWRAAAPARSRPGTPLSRFRAGASWCDLEERAAVRPSAKCKLVLLVDPARRAASARAADVTGGAAIEALRAAWPLVDLPHGPRASLYAGKLAARTRVVRVELSRDPAELPALLDRLVADGEDAPATPRVSASVWPDVMKRRPRLAAAMCL